MGRHLTLVTMPIIKNPKVLVELEKHKGTFVDFLMKWKLVTVVM